MHIQNFFNFKGASLVNTQVNNILNREELSDKEKL